MQLAASPGLEKVQKPEDIDVGVKSRIVDRTANIHLRGVVDEDFDLAFNEECRGFIGADVEHGEFGPVRNVFLAAARQVIHNQHPVAALHQGICNVAADKSGAAGHTDG